VLRDRYVLEARLGSGGTAVVFRASDQRRDTASCGAFAVAVKLLRPELRNDPRCIARLQREFRQTQAAAHANVVRFFDLDCDRGSWFIVMELLDGESLAARLRRAAPRGMPLQEATVVAAGVADALAHAHALGIVHGDVKPANIFVSDAGAVRVLDFGVAPEAKSPREPTAGTRAYASPEVLGGDQAEAADDVFSLACVTCEMLSGRHPYGRGGADSAARAGVLPERPSGLDDTLWQVLARALAFSRPMRPGMTEFSAALRGRPATAAGGSTAAAAVLPRPLGAPTGRPPIAARRTRRVAMGAMAAGLMLVLGILIGRLDRAIEPDVAVSPPVSPIEMAEASVPPAPVATTSVASGAPSGQLPVGGEPSLPEGLQPVATASTGLVTFDLPAMMVSNRAVVAAIPLRHLSGSPRNVRVNWRIIEGSARPGADFGGPESGVESFVAGNNFRILYVPIIANPAMTRDRTFVVELTGATPGVEIGGAPRIAVTILGDR
jgi:hypothetical protein